MKRQRKTRKELKKQIKVLRGHLESRASLHRRDMELLRKMYDSRGWLPIFLRQAIEERFQSWDRAWIRAAKCPATRKALLDSIFEEPEVRQIRAIIYGDWPITPPKDLP